MDAITIPGKLFLIGEYGVIQGGRALIAPMRPGYHFQKTDSSNTHPESPWGLYKKKKHIHQSLAIKPGTEMILGLGSSTAELIAGVKLFDTENSPELRTWYRKYFPKASGADLSIQMKAVYDDSWLFEFSRGEIQGYAERPRLFHHLFLFQSHPDDKLKTHEALKQEIPEIGGRFDEYAERLKNALFTDSLLEMHVLSEFASQLSRLGLERDRAKAIRENFLKIKGVIGVKGCGAGLNDTFIVAIDPAMTMEAQNQCAEVAQKHRLTSLGALSRWVS